MHPYNHLINQVLLELKGVVPYKEGITWDICNADSYAGRYQRDKNRILIGVNIPNIQDIKDTIAHELIHAAGVRNHGKDFKMYCEKVNNLGLGYSVNTQAHFEINEKSPKYEIVCKCCGWKRTYKIHHNDLHMYKCPKCKQKELEEVKLVK